MDLMDAVDQQPAAPARHRRWGVAGIDPHKDTFTVVVLDERVGLEGVASFATSGQGLAAALAWLGTVEFSLDRVGVEGSAWLGNHPEALSATARFTAWPSTLATVRTTGPKARRTMEQAMHVVKLSASSSHVLVAEQQGQLMGVLNAAQWPPLPDGRMGAAQDGTGDAPRDGLGAASRVHDDERPRQA
jgi:hypothetical protein